jgi:hypothetical protein
MLAELTMSTSTSAVPQMMSSGGFGTLVARMNT